MMPSHAMAESCAEGPHCVRSTPDLAALVGTPIWCVGAPYAPALAEGHNIPRSLTPVVQEAGGTGIASCGELLSKVRAS